MISKVKLFLIGFAAILVTVFWSLFGIEKAKRKEAETKLDTAEDDIEQQKGVIQAEEKAKEIKHEVNTSTPSDVDNGLSKYYRD